MTEPGAGALRGARRFGVWALPFRGDLYRRLGCRPAGGRLGRNLDCAGPGHRRGRDHSPVAATFRIVAWAEVVKEDNSCTHDCDNCGYYHGYRVAAPVISLSVHLPSGPSVTS